MSVIRKRSQQVARSDSFPLDVKLDKIRTNPEAYFFGEYLHSLCRELLFWVEAERFKSAPLEKRAHIIWHTFFAPKADFQLDSKLFPDTEQHLFAKKPDSATRELFINCQNAVYDRLRTLLQPQFLQSAHYSSFQQLNSAAPVVIIESFMTSTNGGTLSQMLDPLGKKDADPAVPPPLDMPLGTGANEATSPRPVSPVRGPSPTPQLQAASAASINSRPISPQPPFDPPVIATTTPPPAAGTPPTAVQPRPQPLNLTTNSTFVMASPSTPVQAPQASPFAAGAMGSASTPSTPISPPPRTALTSSQPSSTFKVATPTPMRPPVPASIPSQPGGSQTPPQAAIPKMAPIGGATGPVTRVERKPSIRVNWIDLGIEDPQLEDVIHDSDCMACFLEYLQSIHAEEILACWLDIELFKSLLTHERGPKGREIVEKYFNPVAPTHISLEHLNYAELLKSVLVKADKDVFETYHQQLWEILSLNSFPKFKESDAWKKLAADNSFKKKHKDLAKNKDWKPSNRAGVVLQKLDDFLVHNAKAISLAPNVSEREFQVEDILYSPEFTCAFRDFLNGPPDLTRLLHFWFDTEIYRYTPETQMRPFAEKVYQEYLRTGQLVVEGTDLADLSREIEDRPNKNTFSSVQTKVWDRLREHFIGFQSSELFTRFFEGNLPLRQSSPVYRAYETLAKLRDVFCHKDTWAVNLSKVQNKMRTKRQQMDGNIDIETVFADREFFISFKEFLVKKQALENLAFWAECENYKYVQIHERRTKAGEIVHKFLDDRSDLYVNLDISDKQKLRDALARAEQPEVTLFNPAQEHIWSMLSFDLMPKYLQSDAFKKVSQKSKNRRLGRIRVMHREALSSIVRWLAEK